MVTRASRAIAAFGGVVRSIFAVLTFTGRARAAKLPAP
jgi:hypothetical protein